MFETGDSILVESPFKVGDKEYPAGVYNISTIITSSGQIFLNNKSIGANLNTLTKARFIKIDPVKNKKEAALV